MKGGEGKENEKRKEIQVSHAVSIGIYFSEERKYLIFFFSYII